MPDRRVSKGTADAVWPSAGQMSGLEREGLLSRGASPDQHIVSAEHDGKRRERQ